MVPPALVAEHVSTDVDPRHVLSCLFPLKRIETQLARNLTSAIY